MNKRAASSYHFGPFHLYAAERQLLQQGKPVPLTQKAFEILLILVEHNGHLLEKDELMKAVWADTFVEEANLTQNISILRKILGEKDNGLRYIETVPRRGYRFIAPVAEVRDDDADLSDKAFDKSQVSSNKTDEQSKGINSLAILPLVNEGADENAEYLSDGITESIINSLSQLPQLRVMAHSTVLRYKGKEYDPQQAGRELGVRAVLTVRVLQLGERLVIRTELVDVPGGWQLWGEQYEQHPSDILAVQEEIARKISDKLRLKLTSEESARLAKRNTDQPAAYHLYLRGRYFLNQYHEKSVMKGIECFERAIELDADYAVAYAGLADSYHTLSTLGLPPHEAMPKAKAAALKAVALDDNLAEAHTSLGLIKLYYDYDWNGAETEYKRALELNPWFPLTHLRYGSLLLFLKQFDESLIELNLALELDPLSLRINLTLGSCLYLMGRYDEAIAQYQKINELDQNYYPAHFCLGLTYIGQQRHKEAIAKFREVCRMANEGYLPQAFLGYAFAISGRKSEARKALKQLKENATRDYVSSYGIAVLYAGLGERDDAFHWLEKSFEERSDWLIFLKVAPEFNILHDDARFVDLLKRIGFL